MTGSLDGERVLVTGGAGFVGSHLTHELLARGATVDVLDNLFAGERRLVPDRATLHEVDLRSPDLEAVVDARDPTVVVHLAALHYIPYCEDHPDETLTVNGMGTRRLLSALEGRGALRRVVFASSAAVYPPRDDPHAETDAPDPMDVYGRTKLLGEDLLELFASRTGVPAASARLFNVYGPDETNPHLIPAILDQLRDGGRRVELGNLAPARDFVYVTDVARALATMATEFDRGYRAYNVGTGTEHTVREVVDAVGEALGEDLRVVQDEERTRESDRLHLCADASRIERELGWASEVDLVDGLRAVLDDEGLR